MYYRNQNTIILNLIRIRKFQFLYEVYNIFLFEFKFHDSICLMLFATWSCVPILCLTFVLTLGVLFVTMECTARSSAACVLWYVALLFSRMNGSGERCSCIRPGSVLFECKGALLY